jgi:hypothetical protein
VKELLLFGPFTGSLSYEYSKFAPYAIFLKKMNPNFELAVFTRPERFDFYGEYSNYLIPLKFENDLEKNQIFFKSMNICLDDYESLVNKIYSMYSKRFDKIVHIYPNIKDFFYKVRWQFSRNRMLYDFQPRIKNEITVNNLLKNKQSIFIIPPKNNSKFFIELSKTIQMSGLSNKYLFITDQNRHENYYSNINSLTPIKNETSTLGYLIEIIKKSKFVISPKGDISNLSLLLKIPTVIIGKRSKIFNPLNTEVSFCDEDEILNLLSKKLSSLVKIKNNFDCV